MNATNTPPSLFGSLAWDSSDVWIGIVQYSRDMQIGKSALSYLAHFEYGF